MPIRMFGVDSVNLILHSTIAMRKAEYEPHTETEKGTQEKYDRWPEFHLKDL